MRLYTTSEFIRDGTLFEKKKNNKKLKIFYKMKIYRNSEFICNEISFENISLQ